MAVQVNLNNVAPKDVADAHYADLNNPHQVDKAQVGLSNVDNTSDSQKAASGPIKDALDLKTDKSVQDPINTSDANRLTLLEDNQNTGVFAVETLASLPPTGSANTLYFVANDPSPSNNGYYIWTGSAYILSPTTIKTSLNNSILAWAISEAFQYSGLTYDASGDVSGGNITWPDGNSGTLSNITKGAFGITGIRYNRSGAGVYVLISITYSATGDVVSRSATLVGF